MPGPEFGPACAGHVGPPPRTGRVSTSVGVAFGSMVANDRPRGPELRVELLAGFRVVVGSRAVDDGVWHLRKPANLVKLLALAPGHRVHAEQVMDALWPGLDVTAASNQLRKALHHVRRATELAGVDPDRFLRRDGPILALDPGVEVDVDRFEAAAEAAARSRGPTDLALAVTLYAGELLPDDRYEDWAVDRREQLRRECTALLVELAARLEARADLDGAAQALRRALDLDPLDEAAHAGLMRLHALAGRRREALRQYDVLRDLLRRDLDVEPDIATQHLYELIRTGRGVAADLTDELWESVGNLRVLAGDAEGAAEAFVGALGADGGGADRRRAARLHRKAAEAHLVHHDPGAAAPHLEAAAVALGGDGDEPEWARVLAVRSGWHRELGRVDEVLADAEDSLKVAERVGDADDVAAAHEALAIAHHVAGRWRDGFEEEIERLGATLDDEAAMARVFDIHHCIGQYHLYGDGFTEDVEEYARRVVERATRHGARRAEAFAWCLLGEALLLRGRWDESAACLVRSAGVYEELGRVTVALPWQRLAELSACRGDSEAARGYLERGMAVATVSPMGRHGWVRLYATATLDALERGDLAGARRAVSDADRKSVV